MSPLCCIFHIPVFEGPYNVLTTFPQFSCTLKVKNNGRKTLKTFPAAHCEKACPEITPGSENHEKSIPIELQIDDLAATKNPYFHKLHLFATHGHQDRKKQVPGIQFFRKVDKSNPIGTQSCQNQSKLQFFSIQSVPFSRWGAFL